MPFSQQHNSPFLSLFVLSSLQTCLKRTFTQTWTCVFTRTVEQKNANPSTGTQGRQDGLLIPLPPVSPSVSFTLLYTHSLLLKNLAWISSNSSSLFFLFSSLFLSLSNPHSLFCEITTHHKKSCIKHMHRLFEKIKDSYVHVACVMYALEASYVSVSPHPSPSCCPYISLLPLKSGQVRTAERENCRGQVRTPLKIYAQSWKPTPHRGSKRKEEGLFEEHFFINTSWISSNMRKWTEKINRFSMNLK